MVIMTAVIRAKAHCDVLRERVRERRELGWQNGSRKIFGFVSWLLTQP